MPEDSEGGTPGVREGGGPGAWHGSAHLRCGAWCLQGGVPEELRRTGEPGPQSRWRWLLTAESRPV